ncbi:MAG: pseudouridine synthase [Candidatus Eisenbacteria bacterium]
MVPHEEPGATPGESGQNAGGPGMRLNRYLALCGIASRRQAMAIVFSGRVTINGEVVLDPGRRVEGAADRVAVDGERVQPPRKWYYLAFHKPRGVLVTAHDELGRPSIDTYFRKIPDRVFPVGRLDRASEGLLLVTNHGELADALLHPSRGVEKVYRVRVRPRPQPAQLARIEQGVPIGAGETSAPGRVHIKRAGRGGALLTLTITEGKKREVRRICRTVGLQVQRLKRVAFAGIRLGLLPPGALRPLTGEELDHLRRLTGLPL